VLGRSGLRVSRLALGTMTFGSESGWGCDEATSRAMFDRYLEAGGNFIDTADIYTSAPANAGLASSSPRATCATTWCWPRSTRTIHQHRAHPNAAGNGRKNLIRSLEASLARLGTDYIDLYFLHTWDRITPVEEVVRTMDDLVRQGKIATTRCRTCPPGTRRVPRPWPSAAQ